MLAEKILLIAVLINGMIFFAQFRAGFLSKLAVKKRHLPLGSISEIIGTDYKMGIIGGGNTQAFFENAPKGTLRNNIWENHIKGFGDETLLVNMADGFAKTSEEENYCFLVYQTTGVMTPEYPCSVIDLKEKFARTQDVFAYQKDSPLKEMFDFFLRIKLESGVIRKVTKRHVDVPMVDCARELDRRLDFNTLFGHFSILTGGALLAILSVTVELAFLKCFPDYFKADTSVQQTPKTLEGLRLLIRRLKQEIEEKDTLIRKLKYE